MHRALRIQETLCVIAANLPRRADLVAMGVSCRTFFDPAMDELWRDISSLAQLVKCLPQECWEILDTDYGLAVSPCQSSVVRGTSRRCSGAHQRPSDARAVGTAPPIRAPCTRCKKQFKGRSEALLPPSQSPLPRTLAVPKPAEVLHRRRRSD